MIGKVPFIALVSLFMLAGCVPTVEPVAVSPAAEDSSKAIAAFRSYFNHLAAGDYEGASLLYGGSYDALRDSNPTVDPDDFQTLFMNACEINGFKCLPVNEVVEARQVSPGEFKISASFLEGDGQVFVRGPCCGASEQDLPPESVFEFRVMLNDVRQYTVMDLPVYVP